MSEPKTPGVEEGAVPFEDEIELPLTDEEEAALREAEADADAGRVVPHSEVRKWLQSIIDGNPQPPPFSWRR